MTSKELIEILNKTRRTPNISLTPEQALEIIKDLEILELSQEVKEIIACQTIDYANCICIDSLFYGEEREKILKWLNYKK